MAKRRRPSPDAIARRIVPIDQAEAFVRVLIYGHNGMGKTRFAASSPNPLIIDIDEKGTRSARKFPAHVFPARTWNDVTNAYWYLRSGDHDFESVALDTLTTMANMCMRHVLKQGRERDPNRPPKTPSMRDWGTLKQHMESTLLAYRNLPMHVIFTAQERTLGDADEGEEVEHVPDLSGGVRGVALGSVDIVGRIYKREVKLKGKNRSKWETRMLVGPHAEYRTKDRTGTLPRILRQPTMPDIIESASKEA